MRLAIGIEYEGSRYSGWQRQSCAPSVQAEVERSLSSVAAHPVEVTCAGRTDRGVHALAQVVHFDTPAARSIRGWVLGTNTGLPVDVAVQWAVVVPDDFHARYSAVRRTYRYLILNRATRSPVMAGRAWWVYAPLDADRMHAAAQALVGEHDFSAFRASECQSRSPIRRLERITVRRDGEQLTVEVTANAFLHHMVRNIVGTLVEVGDGSRPADWVAESLATRDRRLSGPTAPPDGLYFAAVEYPPEFGVPPPAGRGTGARPASGAVAVPVSAIIPARAPSSGRGRE
jgi:tRNA pseudouridine38-40 synthase